MKSRGKEEGMGSSEGVGCLWHAKKKRWSSGLEEIGCENFRGWRKLAWIRVIAHSSHEEFYAVRTSAQTQSCDRIIFLCGFLL